MTYHTKSLFSQSGQPIGCNTRPPVSSLDTPEVDVTLCYSQTLSPTRALWRSVWRDNADVSAVDSSRFHPPTSTYAPTNTHVPSPSIVPARTRSPTFTTGRFPHHSAVIKMVRVASVLCGTGYRYHCFTLTPNEGSGSSASTCDSISVIWTVLWNIFLCAKIAQFQIFESFDDNIKRLEGILMAGIKKYILLFSFLCLMSRCKLKPHRDPMEDAMLMH